MRPLLAFLALTSPLHAAITNLRIQSTQSQAVFTYTAPGNTACSIQVADMNRLITIVSGTQAGGTVSITAKTPHGLLPGAVIYVENSGVSAWNGYQTVLSVPATNAFTFGNGTAGSSSSGTAGVLIDDVNPALYSGANLDSRTGSISRGQSRQLVIGMHDSPVALDGNRYSRALQAASRHVYTLVCGTDTLNGEFSTANAPVGYTLGAVPPIDRTNNQYGYPTVQWSNQYQSLIDPITGFRSVRATAPIDSASGPAPFVSAFDLESSWIRPSSPLNSGAGSAAFTGPCRATNCFLFLRADNFQVGAGATYSVDASSALDWVQVNLNSAYMTSPCTGDDCKLQACLTVNGQTCATPFKEISLTTSAAHYTIGSTKLMDLWQTGGVPAISGPDGSRATGTVNFIASTKVVNWIGGNKFNTKWTAGSRFSVNGVEYPIASIQSENQLTLAAGPAANATGAAYSAGNFGVLLRKKSADVNTVNIGYTTYTYGSSQMPLWDSSSTNTCSRTTVNNAAGVAGYNCFVSQELFWIAADGSAVNDLGFVATQWQATGYPVIGASFWGNTGCGSSTSPAIFDPLNADVWYCVMLSHNDFLSYQVVQGRYTGNHGQGTPGQVIVSCDVDLKLNYQPNFNPPPCLRFIQMMPNPADMLTNGPSLTNTGPAQFNPDYLTWPLAQARMGWFMAGVSSDGYLRVFTRSDQAQNSPGWFAVYSLGDRTPVGTGPNSMKLVGMGPSFAYYPFRWCGIHSVTPPVPGWQGFSGDPTAFSGAQWAFTGTVTAAVDTTLSACPPNAFGATGVNCSDIAISTAQPTRSQDGAGLFPIAPGDIFLMDAEYVLVLAVTDPTHVTVQRAYSGNLASHASGLTFVMQCGQLSPVGSQSGYWDFLNDPLGKNLSGTTALSDPNAPGGHLGGNDVVQIGSGAGGYIPNIGQARCPDAYFPGNFAACYELRMGTGSSLISAPVQALANGPLFAGRLGAGAPNDVDSHPSGNCAALWCADARPQNDWTVGNHLQFGAATALGNNIWKFSAAQGVTLQSKFLPTAGYVGRTPLVDVSGPGSNIAAKANTFCVVVAAGECNAGSVANDIYVNAPFASSGSCPFPGVAIQPDDRNAICLFDAHVSGNAWQIGIAGQDMTGSRNRTMGNLFSRWNQHSVFWNLSGPSTGSVLFSQVRWLDGIRNEDLATILPPYPAPDSVARNTFIATPVTIRPPAGRPVDNIIVEFGYGDNGDPGNFFCSTRQEACVAVSGAVNPAVPYFYEQSESYTGMPCSQGCKVAVPALPQHILYYRWKYRDASGNVVATSQTRVAVIP